MLGLLLCHAATAFAQGKPAQPAEQYDAKVPAPTYTEVAYGPHERQVMDVWKAEAETDGPTPAVMVIHGGAWKSGSKERVQRFADVPRLLDHGVSVIAINYRYIRHGVIAGLEPPVQAPLHDAARALQFVRSNAEKWGIDPQRIGLAGGSAGACSSLWLAMHDDLADPQSDDPVSRQSTKPTCAAVLGAQTTMDPAQMKAWTPNSRYGAHAFGFASFKAWLAARDKLQPWIDAYSPYALVDRADPPIYLSYNNNPAIGQPRPDPTHTANFGVKLQERCRERGVDCQLVYPGAPNVTHPTPTDFLIKTLTGAEASVSRVDFKVDGHRAFLLAPAKPAKTDTGKPWVWYAPTLGRRYPGKSERWMFDRLHATGIAIAGIDVGESYGSPAGRAAFQKLYTEMTTNRGYSKKPVLLGRSRGGLMLYNWAAEHPRNVGGIAGIYPVCNLLSYPGLKKAAPAYDMTPDQLRADLKQHNPIDRLAPLAKAQVPIYHIHGDADKVVPHEKNTAVLASRYKQLGGEVHVELIPDRGHDLWRGWFESKPMLRFVIQTALGR